MSRSCSLNELALFAGTGGGLLGTSLLDFRPVCAVEKEPHHREVLLQRQRDRVLPLFPIWDDIKTFDGKPWRGIVDIVTAGFPCQPFSQAGKKLGKDDERNLWPDTIRVIREVRPQYALLENVPGLIRSGYFGQILEDIAQAGHDAEWDIVGAYEIKGAPHRRERLWILAYDSGDGQKARCFSDIQKKKMGTRISGGIFQNLWGSKNRPRVGREIHGVPNWTYRIGAIGNSQIPEMVRCAWEILTGSAGHARR